MIHLERAIEIVGGQSKLARAVGTTPQAVHQWREKGRVPGERARAVELATGGQVTRYELRPDIFGAAPDEAAA